MVLRAVTLVPLFTLVACVASTAGSVGSAPGQPAAKSLAEAARFRPIRAEPSGAARSDAQRPGVEPTPPDVHIRCSDPRHCPAAVGLIVFDAGEEPERCTATLIAPDRVITASHCLPAAAQRDGASCAEAWIAFPPRDQQPTLWARCKRVVRAHTAAGDGALRQEYAVLRLAHTLDRVPLQLRPEPAPPGSIVTVVSITPHPVYGRSHALESRLCRVITDEPARDALGDAASEVGWLARCPIHAGNSGSPVLDYEGRIRAIVHGGTWTGFGLAVTSELPASL